MLRAVEVEISNTESFCLTSQYLATVIILIYTFVNVMASTQKKDPAVVAQAFFFTLSFLELPDSYVGHGEQHKGVLLSTAWRATQRGATKHCIESNTKGCY